MQRVKIYETGKIVAVKNNEAHALIDAGLAGLYDPEEKVVKPRRRKTKVMTPRLSKHGYKTK